MTVIFLLGTVLEFIAIIWSIYCYTASSQKHRAFEDALYIRV